VKKKPPCLAFPWCHGISKAMPKKVRELEQALKKAGFVCTPGKGSHRKWKHDSGAYVLISGNAGDDAKPYQEKGVKIEIEKTQAKR
jgi:predicted RNA binding protein YcfA (HicA-like mRNA interferase family)